MLNKILNASTDAVRRLVTVLNNFLAYRCTLSTAVRKTPIRLTIAVGTLVTTKFIVRRRINGQRTLCPPLSNRPELASTDKGALPRGRLLTSFD